MLFPLVMIRMLRLRVIQPIKDQIQDDGRQAACYDPVIHQNTKIIRQAFEQSGHRSYAKTNTHGASDNEQVLVPVEVNLSSQHSYT